VRGGDQYIFHASQTVFGGDVEKGDKDSHSKESQPLPALPAYRE